MSTSDTKPKRRLRMPTREQIRDMVIAHAEGWHDDYPREYCPECPSRR